MAEVVYQNHISRLQVVRKDLLESCHKSDLLKQNYSAAEATVRALKAIRKPQRSRRRVCHAMPCSWRRSNEIKGSSRAWSEEIKIELRRERSKYKGKDVFDFAMGNTTASFWTKKLSTRAKLLEFSQRKTFELRRAEQAVIKMVRYQLGCMFLWLILI